jgi:spoIIIJ-associated protein
VAPSHPTWAPLLKQLGSGALLGNRARRAWAVAHRLRGVSTADDWPQEPAERVREIVEGVLDELDLDGEVEIREEDDRIVAAVDGGDDYGLLIGKRGQTIDALQLLAYQAAFRGMRERKRVVVDAAGYRERRRETLVARADRAAEQALAGSESVELDPMSAQERRVVHEYLKDRAGVETYSEGDEPHRCVVVAPLVSE